MSSGGYSAGLKIIKQTRAEYEAAYTVPIRFTPKNSAGGSSC
jgi:hypothetical protein